MEKLVFWEMNEINFDFVLYYINQGKLMNWKKFIDRHGVYTTISEKKYHELEPWIQWPTVRTGLEYAEHNIFRLGDMEESGIQQHWDIIEQEGYKVAALSPINASNKTKNSPFWIPDPWVDTKVSGCGFCHRIAAAVRQAVNDNAQEKLKFSSVLALLEGAIFYARIKSLPIYFKGIWGAFKKQHWSKAITFDRLLSDVFISLWRKHQPDFSVLFLNSGAHIQHHYMCSSVAYSGKAKNPEWYVKNGSDPLFEILDLYDAILAELSELPKTRLMISVGMRQVPYEKVTYYWRLKNHDDFLKLAKIKHSKVSPRMTRDFLIEFDNENDCLDAQAKLKNIKTIAGESIFGEIDNRGKDIFVSLTYSNDIDDNCIIFISDDKFMNLKKHVVFVAIKNGHHDTLGYFLDSRLSSGDLNQKFPLKDTFGMVMNHFDINLKKSTDY